MSKKPAKIQKLFYIRKCARIFIRKNAYKCKKRNFFAFHFLLSRFCSTFVPNLPKNGLKINKIIKI